MKDEMKDRAAKILNKLKDHVKPNMLSVFLEKNSTWIRW